MSRPPRSLADVLADAPPPLRLPDARARVRAARLASGRRTAVLDDDPTGSQAVHGVEVVTVLDAREYASALTAPGATCFVLTNTRSLGEAEAAALTAAAGRDLFRLGRELGAPVDVVLRSDSTLRGHVVAEVAALQEARREVLGAGADGVLLVPAYPGAGRVTAGDVHWARVGGDWVPVGATEFARDATFGYAASDLREFLAERSAGAVDAADVLSVGLEDVRAGGPDRVAEVLSRASGGQFVVVNATEDDDLDVVALGLLEAEAGGTTLLTRTGPSFVRALAGIEPRPPLTAGELGPDRTRDGGGGHGLVVVGSHVGLTSRQVDAALALGGLQRVELDVPALLDPARRAGRVAAAVRDATAAMAGSDVLLVTSRELVRGADPGASLAIARATSRALVEVVRAVVRGERAQRPAWVVAKGGITSHDVAVEGLGIRRARVLGQLFPGQVSVLDPVEAPPEVLGVPYVVFAGNVGDEGSLAAAVGLLRGG